MKILNVELTQPSVLFFLILILYFLFLKLTCFLSFKSTNSLPQLSITGIWLLVTFTYRPFIQNFFELSSCKFYPSFFIFYLFRSFCTIYYNFFKFVILIVNNHLFLMFTDYDYFVNMFFHVLSIHSIIYLYVVYYIICTVCRL